MVPREAQRGQSFKGAGLYYLHDKEAITADRVAFTHTENVPTQDPEKALKWMSFTAMHAEDLKRQSGMAATGPACRKPVFTFSLAWHPEQEPKKWEMIGAGRSALAALGLAEHETVMVAHRDADHQHIHCIVNVINPNTGRANTLSYSKLKLSKWAEAYERDGGKIYCEQRVQNNQQREEKKFVKYCEPELDLKAHVTQLYNAADNGKAFQAALSEAGYKLAQGKRLVIIDRDGNMHSLSRQIDGAKAKDIRAKLADLKLLAVDDARAKAAEEKARADRQKEQRGAGDAQAKAAPGQPEQKQKTAAPVEPPEEAQIIDRDAQERHWQESIIDAGIQADRKKAPARPRPAAPAPPRQVSNVLQDRHLRELGAFYDESQQTRNKADFNNESQYGQHERRLRREVAELEEALKNTGRARLWWMKLTGKISKTAETDLDGMRQTLQNIEWRKTEARQAIERDIEQRRTAITARQERERREHEASAIQSQQHRPPVVAKEFAREEIRRPQPDPQQDNRQQPAPVASIAPEFSTSAEPVKEEIKRETPTDSREAEIAELKRRMEEKRSRGRGLSR